MLELSTFLCYITNEHESVFLMEEFGMAEKIKKDSKTAKEKAKKNTKKQTKKKEIKQPKENYIKQVRKELKLVKWPTLKEVVKYTVSTIVFCLIICVFFILLNLLMSYVKGLFV